jgi:hypothetical protein
VDILIPLIPSVVKFLDTAVWSGDAIGGFRCENFGSPLTTCLDVLSLACTNKRLCFRLFSDCPDVFIRSEPTVRQFNMMRVVHSNINILDPTLISYVWMRHYGPVARVLREVRKLPDDLVSLYLKTKKHLAKTHSNKVFTVEGMYARARSNRNAYLENRDGLISFVHECSAYASYDDVEEGPEKWSASFQWIQAYFFYEHNVSDTKFFIWVVMFCVFSRRGDMPESSSVLYVDTRARLSMLRVSRKACGRFNCPVVRHQLVRFIFTRIGKLKLSDISMDPNYVDNECCYCHSNHIHSLTGWESCGNGMITDVVFDDSSVCSSTCSF